VAGLFFDRVGGLGFLGLVCMAEVSMGDDDDVP
jgi:hypothetical protein